MARPRSALTTFILSLPHDLPIKEVIAQAKAKGMKATESNVYRVRRLFKAKAGKGAAPKTKTPSAKPTASAPTTATSSKAPQSKVGFIRSLPTSMPVAEVVARAKAASEVAGGDRGVDDPTERTAELLGLNEDEPVSRGPDEG